MPNRAGATLLLTIFTTIIAALCITGILAAVKSRWLYLITPKLYLNTPISDGQILSFTILNAGFLPEEDIVITFKQVCKFELIATSKSTLLINNKKITIPKIAKFESIDLILLFEGRAFESADIESIESKATQGKLVDAKEKATSFWHHFIVWPIIFLVLLIPFIFGTVVGAENKISAFGYVNNKLELFSNTKQLAGYNTSIKKVYASKKFDTYLEKTQISLETIEIIRKDDVLTIATKLSNNTKDTIIVSGDLKTSAGDLGPLDYWDGRVKDTAVAGGESKIVKQKAYLPESQTTKKIVNNFRFEDLSAEYLMTAQTIDFN